MTAITKSKAAVGLTFQQYNQLLQLHVKNLTKHPILYTVQVDGDVLWEKYLNSFPAGTNEVFRTRREFDCSCCRRFVKSFGNVVVIEAAETCMAGIHGQNPNKATYSVRTIWDFDVTDVRYFEVNRAMAQFVSRLPIENVFCPTEASFGTEKSHEQNKETKEIIRWDHFYCTIPQHFVVRPCLVGPLLNERRTARETFERSLTALTQDSVETVLDLIGQGSLYKGEEWKVPLEKFLGYQKAFRKLFKNETFARTYGGCSNVVDGLERQRDWFLWTRSIEAGQVVANLRGKSIGTLLVDLSAGMDLDEAVRKYEAVVAPSNYKRPKEIFTRKMVEEAEKTLQAEGLLDSLGRRFATIDDITVNNILFRDRDVKVKGAGTVFDALREEVPTSQRGFERVEEVSIEQFVNDILPNVTHMEVLLENKHVQNLVSLIAPQNPEAKSLFKWNNGFSWAYNGNITDSMKERVKAAGGNVVGCLRFSIQWNEEGDNRNDFDAHCHEPGIKGNLAKASWSGWNTGTIQSLSDKLGWINFRNARRIHPSSGVLDVDIRDPGQQVAVENISYSDLRKMPEGVYTFFVHCWTNRGGRSGFRAEIEFDGQVFQYDYPHPMREGESQIVAEVEYRKATGFRVVKSMDSKQATRTVWGLKTNNWVPVSVLMYSPNYWDGAIDRDGELRIFGGNMTSGGSGTGTSGGSFAVGEGVGHRHYFFMLRECINPETPNGFFNEFLRQEYTSKHKRVFAALGNRMKVEPSENQLSGLGFSATKRADVKVKVEGRFTRTLCVKF